MSSWPSSYFPGHPEVSDDRVRVGYLLTATLAVLYNSQDLKEIDLSDVG